MEEPIQNKRIVIVDNYGRFERRDARIALIKSRLFAHAEEMGIPIEISVVAAENRKFQKLMKSLSDADAFVLTGSLKHPTPKQLRKGWMMTQQEWLRQMIARRDTPPILGICFGHQLLGATFGATLERRKIFEDAHVRDLQPTKYGQNDPLMAGETFPVICNHSFQLSQVPTGFRQIGWSHYPGAKVQFIKHKNKPIWGIQGHPEGGYILEEHPREKELKAACDAIFSRFLGLLK